MTQGSGGSGGVTVWDREEGTVLEQEYKLPGVWYNGNKIGHELKIENLFTKDHMTFFYILLYFFFAF